MQAADLIPWAVLPRRTRAQLTDIVRYSGFDFCEGPKVDPAQLRLPLIDSCDDPGSCGQSRHDQYDEEPF